MGKFDEASMMDNQFLKFIEDGLQKESQKILEEAHRQIDNKMRAWVASIALGMTERADFHTVGNVLTITVHIPKPEDLKFLRDKED